MVQDNMTRSLPPRLAQSLAQSLAGTRRLVLMAGIIGCACAATPSASNAASQKVQLACADDFFAYCSGHDPASKGARKCMRTNGAKLSPGCVGALIEAGEVSKKEVARRASLRK